MTADLHLLRSLYVGPNLCDMGDGLAAQLAELERNFTQERADDVVRNLHGAATHVRRMAVDRQREGGGE